MRYSDRQTTLNFVLIAWLALYTSQIDGAQLPPAQPDYRIELPEESLPRTLNKQSGELELQNITRVGLLGRGDAKVIPSISDSIPKELNDVLYQVNISTEAPIITTSTTAVNVSTTVVATTTDAPNVNVTTTVRPYPPLPSKLSPTTTVIFAVIIAIVVLLLCCLLYYMFFGRTEEEQAMEMSRNPPLVAGSGAGAPDGTAIAPQQPVVDSSKQIEEAETGQVAGSAPQQATAVATGGAAGQTNEPLSAAPTTATTTRSPISTNATASASATPVSGTASSTPSSGAPASKRATSPSTSSSASSSAAISKPQSKIDKKLSKVEKSNKQKSTKKQKNDKTSKIDLMGSKISATRSKKNNKSPGSGR